jgi:hypothetical protein
MCVPVAAFVRQSDWRHFWIQFSRSYYLGFVRFKHKLTFPAWTCYSLWSLRPENPKSRIVSSTASEFPVSISGVLTSERRIKQLQCHTKEAQKIHCLLSFGAESSVFQFLLFFFLVQQPNAGQRRLICGVFTSFTMSQQSVGLPCTRDQPVAETSTWQHTTLNRDRHPCPRRNTNPRSQ